MEPDEGEPFDRRLESLTTRFVDRIATCLDRLAELVSLYGRGEPIAACVRRVRDLESECDDTYRSVATHVSTIEASELGIRLTGIHLNRDQLLGLFATLDEIANGAERFASDLEAIEPPVIDDCLDGLVEMIATARAGMRFMVEAVPAFVRSLTDPGKGMTIDEIVGPARRIESHADDLRDDVIEAAFERESGAVALVYRELALLLDGVVDAMEDVTDRMLLVGGDSQVVDLADGARNG